ncbi:outer membrane beta-barrel domain-containing protein [Agaribacter marinus]|uniref:Outer membrane protein beta-barrel domain-containing protein n=1 Tax=Agaribacter marinus TaxID=1431249 RepID=A0AA37WIN8_9ALTE|nr:outer membrane beta-barrel domain-containing protein [Agaribacter marinus]GLR71328.1 hypothetical protein GCM10007852_22360 [Agaribacter marinus]
MIKRLSDVDMHVALKTSISTTRDVLISNRLKGVVSYCVLCLILLFIHAQIAMAQEDVVSSNRSSGDTNIDPNIERRSVEEFDIDSENIEVGVFAGIISIEDFSSDVVLGARIAYHVSENVFIEATYGQATAGETSFEVLSGGAPFLTEEERDYTYYDVSLGYNFNGEVFFTKDLVFNTDFFVTLGAGNTDFAGDERFTVSAGIGYRLLVTDYLSVRFDVRDHVFDSDIIGVEKSVHNLMFTLSTSIFF